MQRQKLFGVFLFLVIMFVAVISITTAAGYMSPSSANIISSSTSQVTLIPKTAVKTPAKTAVTTPVPTPAAANSYTLAQVSQHSNAQSCWSAINGNVYDLTSWINQHPGGQQAILSVCGVNGSAAFNGQHGGQRRPASELVGFKIGALTN